jgi:hypothetical protein
MSLPLPSRGPWRERGAYTLVEVMVTVFIVMVVAISLFAGFTAGFAVVKVTREDLRATQILVQWMETARLYTWTQINSNAYVPQVFTDVYDPLGVAVNAGGTLYVAHTSLQTPTNLPIGYNSNMLTFTVTLCWTNYMGNRSMPQSRQMQTYIARYGLQNYVFSKP